MSGFSIKNKQLPIIFIAGGSASGKTTLAKAILAAREGGVILRQDSFYECKTVRLKTETWPLNFDIPESIDFKTLTETAVKLSSGEEAVIPLYDYATSTRQGETTLTPPETYLIVEGTMILNDEACRSVADLSVFVDASEELRKARRVPRDVAERGWSEEDALFALTDSVFPGHNKYVQPSMAHADIVLSAPEMIDNLGPAIERIFSAL